MKQKRVEWIDMVRGCAIALVVLGHSPIPGKLSSYIYSFHIPLFFIISGFLIQGGLEKKWTDFLKGKFMRLVVPYLFFSLIVYVWWLITRSAGLDPTELWIDPSTPLNGTFIAIRGGAFMAHNAALWFICCLFMSEIAFYWMYRFVKGDKAILAMTLFLSAIIGILYVNFNSTFLPWSLDAVPIALVFVGVGFFLKEYYAKWLKMKKKRTNLPIIALLSLLVINVLAWRFNTLPGGRVDMFYSIYGNFLLYFVESVAGSMMVMVLFESFIPTMKSLLYMGRHSLVIYALHQKVLFGIIGIALTPLVGRTILFSSQTSLGKLGNGIVYLIGALLLSIPAIWLFNKYTPVLIGCAPKKRKASTT